MRPAILVIVVLVLSFLFTGFATRYARWRGLIDHPGERHSHSVATPRGGGIGLMLALVLATILFFPDVEGFWTDALLPGMAVLSLLGWWDDHRSLSARFRFLVQLAVSIALLAYVVASGWSGHMIALVAAGLTLLWMTNLYNFMDGSNGMVGAQGVFASAMLCWLFYSSGLVELAAASAMVGAACLGFLPWNLGRAKVFMGDVGSVALGFCFGSLLIYGVVNGSFDLPVALLIMVLFLIDASLTLLKRVIRGEQWYNPHRQHLYQQLIASGWTHGRVLFLYQAINLMLVVPGIIVAVRYPALAWVVTLALVLAFGTGWYLMTRRFGVLA